MNESSVRGHDGVARFHPHEDWFVTSMHAGVHYVHAWAVAERLVDLLHMLTVHLDPAVDVALHDVRTHCEWRGELLALPDVREVIGRLRMPLASFGGVEFTVYTPDDQLTLTPDLLLVIYSRTTRWSYLLDGLGLEERDTMPAPTWHAWNVPRAEAPELAAALALAAARLGLDPVSA